MTTTTAMTEAREAVLNAISWDFIDSSNVAYWHQDNDPFSYSCQIAKKSLVFKAGIDPHVEADWARGMARIICERVGVDYDAVRREVSREVYALWAIKLPPLR